MRRGSSAPLCAAMSSTPRFCPGAQHAAQLRYGRGYLARSLSRSNGLDKMSSATRLSKWTTGLQRALRHAILAVADNGSRRDRQAMFEVGESRAHADTD